MKNIILTILLILISIPSANAKRIYVKNDATGSANGTSWNDAYLNLRTALQSSLLGDEIWVAKGVYKPTSSVDRKISFDIPAGVRLIGGFEGHEDHNFDISLRIIRENETTLSGEIGNLLSTEDNSYHVLTTFSSYDQTIIDGFTIRDGKGIIGSGYNNGIPNSYGAGCYNYGRGAGNISNPQFINCYFTNNHSFQGGAVFNDAQYGGVASPTFINCVFHKNYASYGAGICSHATSGRSSPSFEFCTFSENSANVHGGGLYLASGSNSRSTFLISNSLFNENYANLEGDDIFNLSGVIDLKYVGFDAPDNSDLNFNGTLLSIHTYFNSNFIFVNPNNGDFNLQCNSDGISQGTYSSVSQDIAGRTRFGLPDLGAYDYDSQYNYYLNNEIIAESDINLMGTDFIEISSKISNSNITYLKGQRAIFLNPGFLIAPQPDSTSVFRAEIVNGCL
ncbi:hypothetical protein [Arcticibacterium luteifluviistationis]|uniref:Right handed beta helix domain-containing protein n=1 Tax=Arcticibacterium luteifluviistationis TaxID=1784714 RepID=A0A2Z4G927_9BACT|nr:hypothetical protein [Arcticibacterium luteifluviistationis]AWV97443.1 hypothetical protein DJ013_04360 [Arcticibacterium luteifluviistationis]